MRPFDHLLPVTLALALGLVLVGCGGQASDGDAPTADGDGDAADAAAAAAGVGADLASVILAEAPGDAVAITTLKQDLEPGREVVLTGRVGGRADPFIGGRAAMQVVDDQAIAACDTIPGDVCQKPWDFCCESQADIAAASATIQVVGDDGRPVSAELRGVGGLAPGSTVTVTGTVNPASADGNLIVDATGIHVKADAPVDAAE